MLYPTRNGRIVEGLQAADFEVLEDGVAQKIESFEHIVPTHGPQTARAEAELTTGDGAGARRARAIASSCSFSTVRSSMMSTRATHQRAAD